MTLQEQTMGEVHHNEWLNHPITKTLKYILDKEETRLVDIFCVTRCV
jgi:hypothetical protein